MTNYSILLFHVMTPDIYLILLNIENVPVNKHALYSYHTRIEVEVAALQVTPTPQNEAVAAMFSHPGSCLCIKWSKCAF